MIEQDTIRLLRECDAGIHMGVKSIDDVLKQVRDKRMKEILMECKKRHERLGKEVEEALHRFHDEGKEPGMMATAMSWMKTEMKMAFEASDRTIAELMTDGCNMGVKSLNSYLNEYKAADEYTKDLTKKLIALESQLAEELQPYL